MNTITLEWLKKAHAAQDMVNFFIRNKLIGMPFELSKDITGDYRYYFNFLKSFKPNRHWVSNFHNRYLHYKYRNGWIFAKGATYGYKYDTYGDFIFSGYKYKFDENGNIIWNKYCSDLREFKYDNRGNMIWKNDHNVNIIEYQYEYYSDGQLKSITSIGENLYIPWFEKT